MSVRRIFLRRDTAANWSVTSPNPIILAEGEPGFDTTNQILKIGDGVTAWNDLAQFQGPAGQDGQDGADGVDGIDGQDGISINSYTTANLPGGLPNGTIAYDEDIGLPIYFKNNAWYKVSNDELHKDITVEIYIFGGQSNMGGHGQVTELSNYNQADGDGTLDEVQSNTIFSYTSYFNGLYQGELTPGKTSDGSDKHSVEISFMDYMRYNRQPIQAGVKHYIDGGAIDEWDDGSTGWLNLVAAIEELKTYLEANGHPYTFKGFVWFQGESDGGRTAAEHKVKVQSLIDRVRTYVDTPELTVALIGVQVISNSVNQVDANINEAYRQLHSDSIAYIPTDAYATGNMILGPGNNYIHFLTPALIPIGTASAVQIYNILEGLNGWTPDNNSKIVSWFDTDDTDNKIVKSNNKISEWKNRKSLGSFVQSNASLQPTFSAGDFTGLDSIPRASVHFDTAASCMQVNDFFQASTNTGTIESCSFFFVFNMSSSYFLWQHGLFGSRTNIYVQMPTWDDGYLTKMGTGWNNGDHFQSALGGGNIQRNTDLICHWEIDGLNDQFTFRINGQVKHQTAIYNFANNFSPSSVVLGAMSNIGQNGAIVKVGDVLGINSSISTDEREQIEGYLAYKYGITLTGHTYEGTYPLA